MVSLKVGKKGKRGNKQRDIRYHPYYCKLVRWHGFFSVIDWEEILQTRGVFMSMCFVMEIEDYSLITHISSVYVMAKKPGCLWMLYIKIKSDKTTNNNRV